MKQAERCQKAAHPATVLNCCQTQTRPLLWSPLAACCAPLHPKLCIVLVRKGLDDKDVLQLIWRPREGWRSVATASALWAWPCSQWSMVTLTLWFYRPPRHGSGAVIAHRFHVGRKPLTAKCAIFSSEEISGLDLHRFHPITVPRRHSSCRSFVCRSSLQQVLDFHTWIQWLGEVTEYFLAAIWER